MKKYFISLLAMALIFTAIATADATGFTATLTADNHYALYYGDGAGNVTLVGRNELTSGGNPGQYNWSAPESFTFNVNPGQYIYVAGWSDGSVAQGWIGQFVSSSNTILTDTTHWQVYLTSVIKAPPADSLPAPSTSDMLTYITNANPSWSAISNSLSNGASPWNAISGIDSNASWIWGSQMVVGGNNNYGEFQIFRTQIAAVPEPTTLLFLGFSLLGLGMVGRRIEK